MYTKWRRQAGRASSFLYIRPNIAKWGDTRLWPKLLCCMAPCRHVLVPLGNPSWIQQDDHARRICSLILQLWAQDHHLQELGLQLPPIPSYQLPARRHKDVSVIKNPTWEASFQPQCRAHSSIIYLCTFWWHQSSNISTSPHSSCTEMVSHCLCCRRTLSMSERAMPWTGEPPRLFTGTVYMLSFGY